jgi:putative peptidoglycan lipid II flippase
VYLFVLRAFYSHQDTRTPFVINVVQNVLNIVLAVLLVGRYDILGLAAALAISYVVCALWALQVLSYKVPGFPLRTVMVSLSRIVVAAAVAGEISWIVAGRIGADAGAGAWARVVVGGLVGIGAYAGLLAVLRAPELAALRSRLPGRRSASAA